MKVAELKHEHLGRGFCVYVPDIEHGNLITIEAGTGDNLRCPGEDEDFADYVNWYSYDMYVSGEPELVEHDGGMVMYYEPCEDIPMRKIVQDVLEYNEINPDAVDLVTVIETK